jgi:hypothetical protein
VENIPMIVTKKMVEKKNRKSYNPNYYFFLYKSNK